jgi:hypothetical protein
MTVTPYVDMLQRFIFLETNKRHKERAVDYLSGRFEQQCPSERQGAVAQLTCALGGLM